EEERVSSPSILRLIFQGRFLHGNVTLGALKLPPGRTTVMHLVARETLPEPNSHGEGLYVCAHRCAPPPPHTHTHSFGLLSNVCVCCRSEEQRENHREQLLHAVVNERKPPPPHTHTHTHTNTHTHTHTLGSLLPVSCGLEAPQSLVWALACLVPGSCLASRLLLHQQKKSPRWYFSPLLFLTCSLLSRC
ncbi:unnamed protein product, partial [Tetraodon nigroviridis]